MTEFDVINTLLNTYASSVYAHAKAATPSEAQGLAFDVMITARADLMRAIAHAINNPYPI